MCRLTPASISALRIALVIFALWVLVVEPTFRAFELMEQPASRSEGPQGNEGYCDLDQPIPPGEVVAPCWLNQHVLDVLAAPLLDPVRFGLPFGLLAATRLSVPLLAELCMPYPPAALPLRL